MKVRLDYEADESDDDSSLDEGTGTRSPQQQKVAMSSILETTDPSTPEPAPANLLLDHDETSISDSSLLGITNPVTALEEEDSWQFDLGVIAGRNDIVHNVENATKTSTLNLSNTNDFDTLSKVSIMSEDLTVISHEIEEADRAIEQLLSGKADKIKDVRNGSLRGGSNHRPLECGGAVTSEFLEKRKRERKERLARARQRISKDKQTAQEEQDEAERRRKEKEMKKAELDMSEEARRDRAYQWYSRCGQPSRKELKKRISSLKFKEGVSLEDVDLLPWNFNGSMINVSQMISMSLGMEE